MALSCKGPEAKSPAAIYGSAAAKARSLVDEKNGISPREFWVLRDMCFSAGSYSTWSSLYGSGFLFNRDDVGVRLIYVPPCGPSLGHERLFISTSQHWFTIDFYEDAIQVSGALQNENNQALVLHQIVEKLINVPPR